MFGNLFDEIMSDTNNAAKGIDGEVIERPPNERGTKRLIGIRNQGATCYLNSLLQTLFLTPEFREGLFKLSQDELGKISEKKKNSNVRVIPIQLQLLFARLLLLDQDSCNTKELTDSFGWQNSEAFQQHDVQELSRILFDAIESSLVGTSGSSLIHDIFKGNIVNQIECCTCHRVSERKEEFLDITVSVASERSLEKTLSNMFESHELMSGKNQYFCEQCNKLVDAKKGAVLGSCPPILTISLLRFNYDMKTLSRYKETGHFAFPVKLDISKYLRKQETEMCTEYTLYSVIIHKGNAHRGHYIAYIRDVDGLGESDIPVEDADHEPDFSSFTKPSAKLSKTGKKSEDMGPEEMLACLVSVHKCVKFSDLGRILQEETGITWNKKYRKRYGTMLKFIRSCPQTFELDPNEQTIKLCESHTFHPEPLLELPSEESLPNENDADLPSPIPNGNDINITSEDSVNESPQKSFDSATNGESHRIGASWFNVNDESIKPIPVYSIPDQFSGQQSAYMLFYRRKDLQRPGECWEDRSFNVPKHITEIINGENDRLSCWREAYKEAINRLDLHIHVGATCTLKDQLIVPNEMDGYLLHIDKRQPVSQLLLLINEYAQKLSRRKKKRKLKIYPDLKKKTSVTVDTELSHIHAMKVLPHGGLHLYECVSDNKEISLQDAKITSGVHLFCWNGKSILGKHIMYGKEFEPIAVELHCKLSSRCNCELRFAVIPEKCFDTVKQCACEILHVDVEELHIERRVIVTAEDGSTAETFDAISDDAIQHEEMFKAKTKSSFECSHSESNGCDEEILMKVKVQNHMLEGDEKYLSDAIYTFDIIPGTEVQEVQKIIGKTLQINRSCCDYRLSLVHSHEIRPMYGSAVLIEYDLFYDGFVVVEKYPPPAEDQVILFVRPLSENIFIEVMVEMTADIYQVTNKIQSKLKMNDNDWHICRSNCYGDKGAALTKLDQKLSAARIENATYLLVAPGRILKDGMISIKLWWNPPPRMLFDLVCDNILLAYIYQSKAEHNINSHNSQDLEKLRKWKSVTDIELLGQQEIGNIEVSKDGTMFDLGSAIRNALPEGMAGKSLRIRVVEKFGLSRVLPNNSEMTLKRLKVQNSTQLSVQHCDSSVGSKDEAILNIVFHVPGTRSYTDPVEFKCSANPLDFIKGLSDILNTPPENLKIAKKDIVSHSWKILHAEDYVRVKPKKKGSKSNAKRKSITKQKDELILLKDFEVIGVKLVQEENRIIPNEIELDDFDTEDDLQQRIKISERDKKSPEQTKYSFSHGKDSTKTAQRKSPRNKEAALKIHVQNFNDKSSDTD